jgi:porin
LHGSAARADDTSNTDSTDYGGSILAREYLLGNWLDYRPFLDNRGITVECNLTQFFQGMPSGGLRQQAAYGNYFATSIDVDGAKLGFLPGSSLSVRFEANWGTTINRDTGSIAAAALAPSLPALNDGAALTEFLYTQKLSKYFSVFFGKMNTINDSEIAFASGHGIDQFMNTGFVYNAVTFAGMPYSTLAAGFTIMKDEDTSFSFTVMDPRDRTHSSVFNEPFATGVTLNPEVRVPVKICGLPGHHVFGGDWSSKTFLNLTQESRFLLPAPVVPIARKAGTWNVYYDFDQYLVSDSKDPTKGWGIFGRFGISDGNPNPLKYLLSGGVGGKSPIPGRDADSFGVGYSYSGASSELGPIIGRLIGNGQAVEAFYSVPVTPWFRLSADVQVIRGGFTRADTAFVMGLRGKIDF